MKSFVLVPALIASAVLCAPVAPRALTTDGPYIGDVNPDGPYIGDATPDGPYIGDATPTPAGLNPWHGKSLPTAADGTRSSNISPEGNPWHGEYNSNSP
jgi:hypothetical protein